MIRTLARIAASLFLLAFTFACNAAPQAGVDYRLIQPPQPVSGKKIEVIEFFSYNCPHCADFEPSLQAWLKRKPKDVEYRSVSLDLGHKQWQPAARLFYTLEVMGLTEKYHQKVFDTIHKDGKSLTSDQAIKDWAKGVGIDGAKFDQAYDSFTVDTNLKRGLKMGPAYGVTGTPSVAVNGKYVTGPKNNNEAFFRMLDELIDMERRNAK
jgi:thiol:disulfide interchange protein DsbA